MISMLWVFLAQIFRPWRNSSTGSLASPKRTTAFRSHPIQRRMPDICARRGNSLSDPSIQQYALTERKLPIVGQLRLVGPRTNPHPGDAGTAIQVQGGNKGVHRLSPA